MSARFDDLDPADRFTDLDQLVFAAMLLGSVFIGIFIAMGEAHLSHSDYLMGSHSLNCLPVAFSLAASFTSALTMLETPAEVYRFGSTAGLFGIAYCIMVVISAEVFLPIYYRLDIGSTYEIIYTGIVLFSPSHALNKVTGVQLWESIISTAVICTFYCTVGGLKAIVWTDVFQFTLMICALLAVLIRALIIKGGIGPIIDDAVDGGRIRKWDFDPNPLRRHTFWTVVVGGTFTWLSVYGTNHCQVQRYLACRSQREAKKSLYITLVGICLILCFAIGCGFAMYSIYKDCDPWTAGFVSAPDQIMPYLVMDILGDFPGLPGLFVAGTFSGTLSTMSSSINALAVVTVEDLIKPNFKVSETNLAWISVGTKVLYGSVCLSMAGVASVMSSFLQAAFSLFGIVGGPLLGIFSLGILMPFANSKGAFSGLLCGFIIVLWIGFGSRRHPAPPHRTLPLPLSVRNCTKYNTTQLTTTLHPTTSARPDKKDYWWFSLSYLYFNPLGTLITFTVGSIMSLVTGGLDQHVESKLMYGKEDIMANFRYWKNKWVQLSNRLRPTVQPIQPVVCGQLPSTTGAVEDTLPLEDNRERKSTLLSEARKSTQLLEGKSNLLLEPKSNLLLKGKSGLLLEGKSNQLLKGKSSLLQKHLK
ncbi:sodium-coupled monocarboxylate transporter 1-like isoform X2 [Podarcis raffonei]|uniref:sodium-coupled monocarboxylate transporter 1-like isoform X2 n=1 Tax=Podarcis raffonei TaxID=65483 RepID=UPI0023290DD7|nr:sodium-coupled monocarboxylate transporter 1-like isoform X2 [Podarcis raffonei]